MRGCRTWRDCFKNRGRACRPLQLTRFLWSCQSRQTDLCFAGGLRSRIIIRKPLANKFTGTKRSCYSLKHIIANCVPQLGLLHLYT